MKKTFGIRYKGNKTYYEKHHIIPHSLNGSDEEKNLVLLTAREHFICHWLLVKKFKQGTVERNKMICAFWKMQLRPNDKSQRYINSSAYEKLKTEYSNFLRINQTGKNNSQYGKHWYTNRDTGECKTFNELPNEKWIKGRNLFCGENSLIKIKINKTIKIKNQLQKTISKTKLNQLKTKLFTYKLWNKYNLGNYFGLEKFAKENNMTKQNLGYLFRTYISFYKRNVSEGTHSFKSNKNLICVYLYG